MTKTTAVNTSEPTSTTPAQEAFQSRPFVEQPLQLEHDGLDIATPLATAQQFGHHFGNISVFPPAQPVIQREVGDGAAAEVGEAEGQTDDTGLPGKLKVGLESMSGLPMDDVNVHYNSSEPAQIGALAHTQGTDIHIAPGQEKHLPHEAWHVVQQKQGRVPPTLQLKDAQINDNSALEREADQMGVRVAQLHDANPASPGNQPTGEERISHARQQPGQAVIQRKIKNQWNQIIAPDRAKKILTKKGFPRRIVDSLVKYYDYFDQDDISLSDLIREAGRRRQEQLANEEILATERLERHRARIERRRQDAMDGHGPFDLIVKDYLKDLRKKLQVGLEDDVNRASENTRTVKKTDPYFSKNVQILSGHGGYAPKALSDENRPQMLTVPEDTTVTMWLPHGSKLHDWAGAQVDFADNFDNLVDFYKQESHQLYVYKTGDKIFNYYLLPGYGLATKKDSAHMFTPEDGKAYALQDLLQQYKGKNIHWAACAEIIKHRASELRTVAQEYAKPKKGKSRKAYKRMNVEKIRQYVDQLATTHRDTQTKEPYIVNQELEENKGKAAKQLLLERIEKWKSLLDKLKGENFDLWQQANVNELKAGEPRNEIYQAIQQQHSNWQETQDVIDVEERWLERTLQQRMKAVDVYKNNSGIGLGHAAELYATYPFHTGSANQRSDNERKLFNMLRLDNKGNDDDGSDFEFDIDKEYKSDEDDEPDNSSISEDKKDEPTESEQDNKKNRTNYTPWHPETIAQCLRTRNRQTIQEYLEGDYPNTDFSNFTNLNIGDAQNFLLDIINRFGFPEFSDLYEMLEDVANELYQTSG